MRPDGQLGAIDLSIDQKPERPDEKARLERAGAIVEPVKDGHGSPVGPPRVWYLAQVAPGLAMSRSIGDSVGAMVGVTAEPEVNERLQPEDILLVLASDGIWEFLSSQDVVRLVSEELRGKPITEAVGGGNPRVRARGKQWLKEDKYVDDISATVLVIQRAAGRPEEGCPSRSSSVVGTRASSSSSAKAVARSLSLASRRASWRRRRAAPRRFHPGTRRAPSACSSS